MNIQEIVIAAKQNNTRSITALPFGDVITNVKAIAEIEADRIDTLENADRINELIVDSFLAINAISALIKGDFAIGFPSLLALITKYKDYQDVLAEIVEEWRDLDAEEVRGIYETFTESFDLKNDNLEAVIEAVVEVPVEVFEEIPAAIALVEEVESIWEDESTDEWEKADATLDQAKNALKILRTIYNAVKKVIQAVKAMNPEPAK